ncbi:caskin-2 [Discoglossus pictus]
MGRENELIQAVKTGDVGTVQKLLAKVRASKNKLLGSTKRLNVNHQDADGFSALHHAALSGSCELLLLLLETQAAVDIKDGNGMRPLHYAAWQGRPEPVRLLLKAAASVNAASHDGQIPLHLAAQYGHYEVSETLLQHQSNPCHVNKARKTPLDLACEFGRVKVVQLLLNSHLCVSLLEGVSKDPTDPNFTTPLHLASKNGHREVIRLLLESGIEINKVTKMGTALHEAALCGKTEVVKLLIENGIDVNIRNTYNQTALDIVNQFTTTHASTDIKQLLREASGILKVRALKDFWNAHDPTALNIRAGDLITVLEQHPDNRWKGHIHDAQKGTDRVGFFPPTIVEVISKRLGSTLSRNVVVSTHQRVAKPPLYQQLPVPGTQIGINPDNSGAGDRHSVGSEGSLGSVRSAGSGQSCEGNGTGTTLLIEHAQTLHSDFDEMQTPRIFPGSVSGHILLTVRGVERDPSLYFQGKDAELIFCWLRGFEMEMYVGNFLSAGYDLPTISRMTPEDLTAIGVTQPGHRKKISTEINRLSVADGLPLHTPADLWEWLSLLSLPEYHKQLSDNGYESLSTVTEITWEGLQEIGIHRLGHQKKLLLGVKRLLDLKRGHLTAGGTLRRRIPGSQDTVPVVELSENGEPPVTPKLLTFQGVEISRELQNALTRGGEVLCAERRSYSQESISSRSQGSGHSQDSATGRVPMMPHQRGLDSSLPERNLPEGTDHSQRPPGLPNGFSARVEPPIPPPKPTLKKRSLSECRYAMSDGEPDEEERGATTGSRALGSYATLTRRPGRCSLTNGQPEKKVQRSQSFAVRARRKGPPPPPPKRLSSMSSAEGSASECQSSVKSIAARLEVMGGVVAPKSNLDLQEVSDGRRRTVSESAAGLGGRLSVPLTTMEDERKEEPASSQHSSSESLPFAEEGNLTIKQRPKPPGAKQESEVNSEQESISQLHPVASQEPPSKLLTELKPGPGAKPHIGVKPDIGAKPHFGVKQELVTPAHTGAKTESWAIRGAQIQQESSNGTQNQPSLKPEFGPSVGTQIKIGFKPEPKPCPGTQIQLNFKPEPGPVHGTQVHQGFKSETKPCLGNQLHPGSQPQAGTKPQLGPKPDTVTKHTALGPRLTVEPDFNLTESDTVKRRPKVKEKEAGGQQAGSLELPLTPNPTDMTQSKEPTVQDTVGARFAEIERSLLNFERGEEQGDTLEICMESTGVSASQSHLVISGPQTVIQKPSWGMTGPAPAAGSILWGSDVGVSSREWSQITQHNSSVTKADLKPVGYNNSLQAEEKGRVVEERNSGSLPLTKNILDDISTMFDDLAEQLDAMLD